MSNISTHVLDTARGLPAPGVPVVLDREQSDGVASVFIAKGETDADGRVKALLPPGEVLAAGVYRLRFDTGKYFASIGVAAFYPSVEVRFTVRDASRHHHVPLLLNPFGYSTYRGT